MKSDELNDNRLSETLQTWKVAESLPPRFQQNVWTRIERGEVLNTNHWFANLAGMLQRAFARPVLAYAYIVTLLAVGLAGGYFKAQERESRVEAQLAARYVQSIDPYHKANH